MKVEGKWTGQYTYGENYNENFAGKSVAFEINVIANGIEFYGNFSDDETRDIFQDSGIVSGFVEGNYIYMEKQYPKAWDINKDGIMEIVEDTFPPLIKYEGALSDAQFEGTWEIHRYYKEGDAIFSIINGTGSWSMNKFLIV